MHFIAYTDVHAATIIVGQDALVNTPQPLSGQSKDQAPFDSAIKPPAIPLPKCGGADPTQIFSWLICESYDDKGSAIRYQYKGENADRVDLNTFPCADNLSSVIATDLFGNGTARLVWSSPLPGDARQPMRYINLMGGQKPHRLLNVYLAHLPVRLSANCQ